MSETPHEIAEREAAEAEAETDELDDGDDGEQGEPEPEPGLAKFAPPTLTAEPPNTANVTPEEWERRFQKAERRFETYQKAIIALWEDDAIHLTPIQVGASAPPGFIDVREAGLVPEDVRAPVLAFYGFAREQDYEADPEAHECPTCKGKGKTATGSKVPGKEKRDCPTCHGQGAVGLSNVVPAGAGNGLTELPFTLAEPSSALAPDADSWEQPRLLPDGRENPNYGRMPQYWVQVDPWGDTRGLGVQHAPEPE